MRKNVAGQTISATLISTTGGAVTTGTTTVYITGDGGTQTSGGTATHAGNGVWNFAPDQAETNFDHISFTFVNTGAVTTTLQLYTSMDGNVISISDDSTAADNLESMYDGTGYTDPSAPASREQVGQLSSGSASISVVADSFILTTGTVAGGTTIDDTKQLNGIEHRIEDVADETEVEYHFNIGSDGIPTEIIWDGFVQGGPDEYQVFLWNFETSDWDQIGELDGTSGETAQTYNLQATVAHVGTGVDVGDVRCQISSLNGAELGTDRILCSYAVVRRTVGYEQGSIWVDPGSGNTGTEPFTDGVADNPVSTLAAAETLSGLLNLRRLTFSPKASFTLAADLEDYYINGSGGSIDMGGQSIDGTVFDQVAISGVDNGIASTSTPVILNAFMINSTIGPHIGKRNGILGNTTLTTPGTYIWDNCFSGVAGTGTPEVTFPAGAVSFNVRHYSGGMQFNGMTADTTVSFEGFGQVIIDASCTGGTIVVRGTVDPVTDNSGGAVTIISDAQVSASRMNEQMSDVMKVDTISEPAAGAPPAEPTFEQALMYVYSALRNQVTVTATDKTFHNSADSGTWKKALSDDATTYTEAEGGVI